MFWLLTRAGNNIFVFLWSLLAVLGALCLSHSEDWWLTLVGVGSRAQRRARRGLAGGIQEMRCQVRGREGTQESLASLASGCKHSMGQGSAWSRMRSGPALFLSNHMTQTRQSLEGAQKGNRVPFRCASVLICVCLRSRDEIVLRFDP